MPSGKDSPDNASIWNMNEKKHCMKDIFPQTATQEKAEQCKRQQSVRSLLPE